MVGNYGVPERILWSIAQLLTLCAFAICHTCNTPDDWLDLTNGETWKNGVVKYKLHTSLTLSDTTEVLKAFEQFHTKTCIRFQPWQEGDPDFVSIEVNDDVCGAANVCKTGGYQFAQFGKDCRNMATMVHQLGHALCLSHEHQRPDRDQYLNFSQCDSDKIPRKVDSFRFNMTIYDYASQMHSQCGTCEGGWPLKESVHKCGRQISPGLSVLDVDKLNSLYHCQGCQRHRWVPATMLSVGDYKNIQTFGYESRHGAPVYACRAFFRQQVASGMYNDSTKTCKLAWGFKSHEVTDQVEVLTIPGGTIGVDCSVYKFKNRKNAEYSSIVNVGTLLPAKDTIFVAYFSENGGGFVGKAWSPNGKSLAEFPVGTEGVIKGDYEVLTCSFDTTCLLKKLVGERMSDTQNDIKGLGKDVIPTNIT